MAKRTKKKGRAESKVAVGGGDEGRGRSGVSMGALFAAAGIKASDAPSAAPEPTPPPADEAPSAPKEIALHQVAKLVVRKVRKGRGGHTVTIVEGFDIGIEDQMLGEDEGGGLHGLARDMKRSLGCAATVAESSIVLHGEVVTRAVDWLTKRGVRRVIRGN